MRYSLLSLLFVASNCIAADWQVVSNANDNGTTFYIDADSVAKDGKYVRAWTMENRTKPNTVVQSNKKINYLSYVAFRVFDCTNKRIAILQGTFYSQQKMKGNALYSFKDTPKDELFSVVAPASMGEAMLEYACEFTNTRLNT